MVDEDSARALATAVLGRPHDDPEAPWELVEFTQGWLIRTESSGRGDAPRVVERDSGRVLAFPSSVPSRRLLSDYPTLASRGFVEHDPTQESS